MFQEGLIKRPKGDKPLVKNMFGHYHGHIEGVCQICGDESHPDPAFDYYFHEMERKVRRYQESTEDSQTVQCELEKRLQDQALQRETYEVECFGLRERVLVLEEDLLWARQARDKMKKHLSVAKVGLREMHRRIQQRAPEADQPDIPATLDEAEAEVQTVMRSLTEEELDRAFFPESYAVKEQKRQREDVKNAVLQFFGW